MSRIYTTKTPSLKATIADIRNLDVKKLTINGENISTAIKEAKTTILDERGTLANDAIDIWNSYITKDENGNVIINRDAKPKEHWYNELSTTISQNIASVVNNQCFDISKNHLMFWQTGGLKSANDLFAFNEKIHTFSSDLSSLSIGRRMFYGSIALRDLETDLSLLHDGYQMFSICKSLTSFDENKVKSLDSLSHATSMFANSSVNYFHCGMPSLVNANEMFSMCENLHDFYSELSSLSNGQYMFYKCSKISNFNINMPSLIFGDKMFSQCTSLKSCYTDLGSLSSASYMFFGCSNIEYLNIKNLNSLVVGDNMFGGCNSIDGFNYDMPLLEEAEYMFEGCAGLTSFKGDMPKLQNNTTRMFYGCTALESFSGDLSNLKSGGEMFYKCYSLKNFNSNLESLGSGNNLFYETILDSHSVMNILHFIPDRTGESSASITIGIGISNSDEQKQAFAEECFCDSWQGLNDEFSAKEWTVTWQFNGPSTFGLRGINTSVYVKLEETTDEKRYEYTSPEGDKFYNISWYHESNGNNEGYTLYDSLNSAIESLGIIPKE